MNIWKWVIDRHDRLDEEGHSELAGLIYDIALKSDDELEIVDQIFHQAIPLCRSLEDKWLELYFRHWRLQAYILKNYEAKGFLKEAISLLDFAYTEDTNECPQRICVVQDLAACYGIKDGPGYVEERVKVCKETLEQIDGSWACYRCIGSELIEAYMDAKQYDIATTELATLKKELHKHDQTDADMQLTQAELLIETGQIDAAWDFIKNATNPDGGDSYDVSLKLTKARILCKQKNWNEVLKICPSYEYISKFAKHFNEWTDIQLQLVQAKVVTNDKSLRFRFHKLSNDLEQKGANRISFEVYERLIELCLLTKESFRAEIALKRMKSLCENFHRDMGAKSVIHQLDDRIRAITISNEQVNFKNADELIAYEFATETAEILALNAAIEHWPENVDLLVRKCKLYDACFEKEKSFALLSKAYEEHESSKLELEYGSAFIKKHGFEHYAQVFSMLEIEGFSKKRIWNRGFLHFEQLEKTNKTEALKVLKQIEGYWSDDVYLMDKFAQTFIALDQYKEASIYRQKQIEAEPDNIDHKWDLLISATLDDNVGIIVKTAQALEHSVETTGKFHEDNQSLIRIKTINDEDEEQLLIAKRIGPVLARVETVSHITDESQLYGREIVFDPRSLNQLDQIDEEGRACDIEGDYTYLYASIKILHSSPYQTFTIDGVHPGADAISQLIDSLEKSGFVFDLRYDDYYPLYWKEGVDTEMEANGIYAYILVNPNSSLETLNDILSSFNETIEHPLIWPKLSEHLEDIATLQKQEKIAEKYGITEE